jgi:parvulin-like peptidyl-prolyl isomerase
MRVASLAREPLLHFVAIGTLLFAAYGWVSNGKSATETADRRVAITEGHLRWVTETWSRQWQKQPSPEELRGLLKDLLKEELLAREARELGLDVDDTIVRRQLAQKMRFVIEDTSRLDEPSEDELRRLQASHPERFDQPSRITFLHVFFNETTRANAAGDARQTLLELASADDTMRVEESGDRLLVEPEINDAEQSEVEAQFGEEFARGVFGLAPGNWQGPIRSTYGLHLVRVLEKTPARQRPFLEARAQLLAYWREERRRELEERYFAELNRKYHIVLDKGVEALIGPLDSKAEKLP